MAKSRDGKRTTARRTKSRANTSGRSDIPAQPKRTITTVSCPFPRADDQVVIHSIAHTTIAATPTASVSNAYSFVLSASNATTGNFDQYKLLAVRVSIVPQNNAIGLVTNTTTALAPLYCVIDYDDATALTTAAQAEGYNNCILLAPGESCMRTFRPHMALAAYSGAFSSYANVEPQWIDAVSNGVQHYGLKVFIPGVTAAQTLLQTWDITFEYAWMLKNNLS